MKKVSKRGFAVLLLVLTVMGGLGVLGYRFFANGEKWATLRANSHLTENGSFVAAGSIFDKNGEILAQTVDNERVYNDSERIRRSTLHIVGDTEGYIQSGVQTAYKTELIGYNPVTGLYSLKKYGRGNYVKLTLDSQISAFSYDLLKGKKGIIAAYNYKTGELLCSVSAPNFDIRNKPSADEIDENKNGQYDGLYMNRLIDALYTPGSTFKIVTTASVIENKGDRDVFSYTCTGEAVVGGVKITCPRAHGDLDFHSAFANSCNCAYGVLAHELGAECLTATAEKLGFGKNFSFGNVSTEKSLIDLSNAQEGDVAWAGVGQYTTLVNPYHMLTVLGAVANGGVAVHPYAVDSLLSPQGEIISKTQAQSTEYVSREVAEELKNMMRNNVEKNYGDNRFKGLSMCAKTGTAEVGDGENPHSWFMGFSNNESCPVAIVVVVENGGWGSSVALPIASQVMEEIYKSMS